MNASEDSTRPLSVAELLARNGTIGSPPVGGRRRRKRRNSDGVSVAELTGEIPVIRAEEDPAEDVPEVTAADSPEEFVNSSDADVVEEHVVEECVEGTVEEPAVSDRDDARGTPDDDDQASGETAVGVASAEHEVAALQTYGESDAAGLIYEEPVAESAQTVVFYTSTEVPEYTGEYVAGEVAECSGEYVAEAVSEDVIHDDEATDVASAEVEAAEVEVAEVESADVESAEVESAEVETADVEAADVEAADVEAADVESVTAEAPPRANDPLAHRSDGPERGHDPRPVRRSSGAEQMAYDPVDESVNLDDLVDEHVEDVEQLRSYLRASQDTLFSGGTVADDLARGIVDGEDYETDQAVATVPGPARPQHVGGVVWHSMLAVLQSLMAVVLGAALFIGFDQLWRWNNLVALILSVLVVLTLAAGVRLVRKTEDIVSTLTAVAVGLLVTLGPLALQST